MLYLHVIWICCSDISYIIKTGFLFVEFQMIYYLIDMIGYYFSFYPH